MMFQLITYNSKLLSWYLCSEQMTQKQICLKSHLHRVDYFLKGTIESLKLEGTSRPGGRGGTLVPKKKVCLLSLEMHYGEGENGKVRLWNLPLHRNHSIPFWQHELSRLVGPPSPRLPTWLLAPLPTSPCSLYSVLGSYSICCWLPACCLGNPRILCSELRGRGTFHSYLSWKRQAAGWEESWIEEVCWSNRPCLARLTFKGEAEGLSWKLLEYVM